MSPLESYTSTKSSASTALALAGLLLFPGCRKESTPSAEYARDVTAITQQYHSGLTIDSRLVDRTFLEHEFAEYATTYSAVIFQGKDLRNFIDFVQTVWSPFIANVRINLAKSEKSDPGDDPYGALKVALMTTLGTELQFNEGHKSALDPIINHRVGARSGTLLFCLVASELYSNSASPIGEKPPLYIMQLDDHMLPVTVITNSSPKDAEIVGYEMTLRGRARVAFGATSQLSQLGCPLRLCAVRESHLTTLLPGVAVQPSPIIFETGMNTNEAVTGPVPATGIDTREPLGFKTGKKNNLDGDFALKEFDSVPASHYARSNRFYGGSTADQIAGLRKVLNSRQIAIVQDYLKHNEVFDKWLEAHEAILDDKSTPLEQRLKQFDKILEEVCGYWNDHMMMLKYQAAHGILAANDREFTMHPKKALETIIMDRKQLVQN